MADDINPDYYHVAGIETIHLARELTFCGGNAIKYIVRSCRIDGIHKADRVKDLKKAIRVLDEELDRLTHKEGDTTMGGCYGRYPEDRHFEVMLDNHLDHEAKLEAEEAARWNNIYDMYHALRDDNQKLRDTVRSTAAKNPNYEHALDMVLEALRVADDLTSQTHHEIDQGDLDQLPDDTGVRARLTIACYRSVAAILTHGAWGGDIYPEAGDFWQARQQIIRRAYGLASDTDDWYILITGEGEED